jgi:2-polyprenyl-3-methyl-5-hydroxy-6-metoxy-1,4-benzoquinol methylase
VLDLHNSSNPIVSLVHRTRIRRVLASICRYADAGGRLLDFGCGDGGLVRLAAPSFGSVVGADITDDKLDAARAGGVPTNARFVRASELGAIVEQSGPFDVVVMSQVLEHVSDIVRDEIFSHLGELTHPTSHIIIEVPIESGPILVVKSTGGRILRRVTRGEYRRPTYSTKELWQRRSIAKAPHVRPPRASGGYYGHRDFSVDNLRMYLEERFLIERVDFIPINGLRHFNLQVLFDCMPK